jgi:hypothetical protein
MRAFLVLSIAILACTSVAPAQQTGTSSPANASPVIKPVADGVYIFEYRGYQSMFIVDSAGVVVTDPMNADAAKVYLAEIRRITAAPIRFVVYSHHTTITSREARYSRMQERCSWRIGTRAFSSSA